MRLTSYGVAEEVTLLKLYRCLLQLFFRCKPDHRAADGLHATRYSALPDRQFQRTPPCCHTFFGANKTSPARDHTLNKRFCFRRRVLLQLTELSGSMPNSSAHGAIRLHGRYRVPGKIAIRIVVFHVIA